MKAEVHGSKTEPKFLELTAETWEEAKLLKSLWDRVPDITLEKRGSGYCYDDVRYCQFVIKINESNYNVCPCCKQEAESALSKVNICRFNYDNRVTG